MHYLDSLYTNLDWVTYVSGLLMKFS